MRYIIARNLHTYVVGRGPYSVPFATRTNADGECFNEKLMWRLCDAALVKIGHSFVKKEKCQNV